MSEATQAVDAWKSRRATKRGQIADGLIVDIGLRGFDAGDLGLTRERIIHALLFKTEFELDEIIEACT